MITATKIRILLRLSAGILVAGGATIGVRAKDSPMDAGDNSQASKIIQDSLAAYAALSSYDDTGRTVVEFNGRTETSTFSILLARTNLYKIEWAESNVLGSTVTSRGAVWSAGDGDFVALSVGDARYDAAPLKMGNPWAALGGFMGMSEGASSTIPEVFFDFDAGMNRLKFLTKPVQQKDEKIGTIDCWVLKNTQIRKGMTNTTSVWIGKQDRLVHQMRSVDERASTVPVPPDLEGSAKEGFQRAMQLMKIHISTETHENISVNKTFKKADFVHEDPAVKLNQ